MNIALSSSYVSASFIHTGHRAYLPLQPFGPSSAIGGLVCPLLTSPMRSELVAQLSASFRRTRLPGATWETSRGKTQSFPCVNARFIKHTHSRMEDFVVTCQLVPDVPHLESGSCTSPRTFGLDFLQTPSHDDALALLLAFGSAKTWLGNFHPDSPVPCPAHTGRMRSTP